MGSGGISFATDAGLAAAAGDGGVGSGSSSLAAAGMNRLSDPPGRPANDGIEVDVKDLLGMLFSILLSDRSRGQNKIRRGMSWLCDRCFSGMERKLPDAFRVFSDLPIQLFTAALAMAGQGPL